MKDFKALATERYSVRKFDTKPVSYTHLDVYKRQDVHYLHRWQVLIPMDQVISHEVEDHSRKRDLRCFQLKQRGPLLLSLIHI